MPCRPTHALWQSLLYCAATVLCHGCVAPAEPIETEQSALSASENLADLLGEFCEDYRQFQCTFSSSERNARFWRCENQQTFVYTSEGRERICDMTRYAPALQHIWAKIRSMESLESKGFRARAPLALALGAIDIAQQSLPRVKLSLPSGRSATNLGKSLRALIKNMTASLAPDAKNLADITKHLFADGIYLNSEYQAHIDSVSLYLENQWYERLGLELQRRFGNLASLTGPADTWAWTGFETTPTDSTYVYSVIANVIAIYMTQYSFIDESELWLPNSQNVHNDFLTTLPADWAPNAAGIGFLMLQPAVRPRWNKFQRDLEEALLKISAAMRRGQSCGEALQSLPTRYAAIHSSQSDQYFAFSFVCSSDATKVARPDTISALLARPLNVLLIRIPELGDIEQPQQTPDENTLYIEPDLDALLVPISSSISAAFVERNPDDIWSTGFDKAVWCTLRAKNHLDPFSIYLRRGNDPAGIPVQIVPSRI